ncbi:MAG: hypothetical protein ACYDBJ_04635 [Aggregatilineales bacterium]
MNGQGRVVWRWVWCWLSVLAAGCGPHGSLATALPPALATLPGYTRVPPTWTPILRVRRTLTPNGSPAATLITANVSPGSAPLPLSIDTPTCSETPVGSLWCVGLIRNSLSVTVTGVIVRVSLVTADGTALTQQDVLGARPLIRPGEWTPYGALFKTPPTEIAGPVAELVSAESIPEADSAVTLPVENLRSAPGQDGDSVYRVQATIHNPASVAVRALIVATLFDSAGHVTGFRQIEPDTLLLSGATLAIDLNITPLIAGTTHSAIFADGLPVKN